MKVILTAEVWERMRAYVDLCPDEISGIGKIERDEDKNMIVTDIVLFEQSVSAAHANITAEALAKFQVEMVKKGESLKDWCFWWHSHANMDVFFSATDTGTIDDSTDFPYLVSLVTNKAHDFVARVDIYEPFRMHTDLDVEIEETINQDVIDACQKEIDEKVSRPSRVGFGRTWYPKGGYMSPPAKSYPLYDDIHNEKQGSLLEGFGITEEDKEEELAFQNDVRMYLELKEEYIEDLKDAKRSGDKAAIQVAKKQLADHVHQGKEMGYEYKKKKLSWEK